MPSWPGVIQFCTFLNVALSNSSCIFASGHSTSLCNSFSMLHIHSVFMIDSLCSHIWHQIVLLPLHLVTTLSSCILHRLVSIFFFLLFWNVQCYFFCLVLSRYLLSVSFFANIFGFISSSHIVNLLIYFVLVLSYQHIPLCFLFLGTFACCRTFFTCPSSLISHPGFAFLFGFLWGTLILSQISFARKLSRLVQLRCPWGYVVIICLPFRFLTWVFSRFGSWGKGK